MIFRILFVMICGVVMALGPIPAETQDKPLQNQSTEPQSQQETYARSPENWTLEERLSIRFDPPQIEKRRLERSGAEKTAHSGVQIRGPGAHLDRIEINGNRNPEFFLRWELFNNLIHSAFVDDPNTAAAFRRIISRRTEGISGRENFWEILEELSAEFIRNIEQHKALGDELQMTDPEQAKQLQVKMESVAQSICRSRAEALAQARIRFGKWQFDRFLYEGIAPGLTITDFVEVDIDHLIQSKRAAAGGCK